MRTFFRIWLGYVRDGEGWLQAARRAVAWLAYYRAEDRRLRRLAELREAAGRNRAAVDQARKAVRHRDRLAAYRWDRSPRRIDLERDMAIDLLAEAALEAEEARERGPAPEEVPPPPAARVVPFRRGGDAA